MASSNLDGCGQFMKYALFFVNFIIFILGLAVCGLGIWTLVDSSGVEHLIGEKYYIPAAALLVTFGGVVALISFLGCCGAIKEVKCLLGMFFVIMLLLSIVIALGAIFAFVVHANLGDGIEDVMKETMKKYDQGDEAKPLTEAWDNIQQKLQCCGATAMTDWQSSGNSHFTDDNRYPSSCCKTMSDNCQKNTKAENYFEHGCTAAVKEFIEKHTRPLSIIGIIIAIVIVLSMIFSCALCLMV